MISTAFAEQTVASPASCPLADAFVARALATDARVRVVEKPELLAEMEGVVAGLRYKEGAGPRDNSPVERKVEV